MYTLRMFSPLRTWCKVMGRHKRRASVLIRRWHRLDRFGDDEVGVKYQNALSAEVNGFSECIKSKVKRGMKGHDLVHDVLKAL